MKDIIKRADESMRLRDNNICLLQEKVEKLEMIISEQQISIHYLHLRLQEVERNINYNN